MVAELYKLIYKSKVKNKKVNLFLYRFIKLFLNIFYPFYCRINRKYKYKKIAKNVIVSLTSFPDRINYVWIVIETLLRQTYRPEKIILWLADTQFKSMNELPKKLLEQQEKGLEIRFCDDLRSHKKYYYTMKYYPNSVVITVDDDTFYPEDLVEKLIYTHKLYPNTICCNLAHLITIENGEIAPYSKWESGADGYDQPSYYLVPVGCGGVLYPPGCFYKDVFDKEKIKELCPLADDLWLKAMATLNGVKAVKTDPISIPYVSIISSQKSSLWKVNVDQKMNDKQMNNILRNYPELKKVWK